MKYRKKPIIIDAWRWEGDPRLLMQLVPHNSECVYPEGMRYSAETRAVLIDTLEGQMICNNGDWIIRGLAGEFYPIKHAIFQATYELVE